MEKTVKFLTHTNVLELPSYQNHNEVIEYMKKLIDYYDDNDIEGYDQNLCILSENKSLLKTIKNITSDSSNIAESLLAFKTFILLIKNSINIIISSSIIVTIVIYRKD